MLIVAPVRILRSGQLTAEKKTQAGQKGPRPCRLKGSSAMDRDSAVRPTRHVRKWSLGAIFFFPSNSELWQWTGEGFWFGLFVPKLVLGLPFLSRPKIPSIRQVLKLESSDGQKAAAGQSCGPSLER